LASHKKFQDDMIDVITKMIKLSAWSVSS